MLLIFFLVCCSSETTNTIQRKNNNVHKDLRNVLVYIRDYNKGIYMSTQQELLNDLSQICKGNSNLTDEILKNNDILFFNIKYHSYSMSDNYNYIIKGNKNYIYTSINQKQNKKIEFHLDGLTSGRFQSSVYLKSDKKDYGLVELNVINFVLEHGVVTVQIYIPLI